MKKTYTLIIEDEYDYQKIVKTDDIYEEIINELRRVSIQLSILNRELNKIKDEDNIRF